MRLWTVAKTKISLKAYFENVNIVIYTPEAIIVLNMNTLHQKMKRGVLNMSGKTDFKYN